MALSTTITKKSVTYSQEGMFNVTLNLLYKSDEVVLIDRDFSLRYKPGTAWVPVFTEAKEKMKAAIRIYKEEQVLLNAVGLDGVVTNLNATVGV